MSEKLSILFSHPNLTDYKDKVYPAIRSSDICNNHTLVLPHEESDEPFDSPLFLKNNPQALLIADVTHKRFGVGTEVGMAAILDRPIFVIIQKDHDLSRSAKFLASQVYWYQDVTELVSIIEAIITENEKK